GGGHRVDVHDCPRRMASKLGGEPPADQPVAGHVLHEIGRLVSGRIDNRMAVPDEAAAQLLEEDALALVRSRAGRPAGPQQVGEYHNWLFGTLLTQADFRRLSQASLGVCQDTPFYPALTPQRLALNLTLRGSYPYPGR